MANMLDFLMMSGQLGPRNPNASQNVLTNAVTQQLNSQPQKGPGFGQKLVQGLNSPLAQLSMQLLANSGVAPAGTSFGQRLGRAGMGFAQQQQQSQLQELQRRLIEAQIGKAGQPGESFEPLTDEQEVALGLDPAKAYQRSTKTGKVSQIGSAGTSVNVNNEGTIPPGYQVERDESGRPVRMVPIPGGPAERQIIQERKQEERRKEAERLKRENQQAQTGLVIEDIDRALQTMETGILPDTGFGAALAGIPGTDAKRIDNLLTTIKANIGFNELQKMREASPTGGALGQVSEREIKYLQSIAGSLDQTQEDEDLAFNLRRLRDEMERVANFGLTEEEMSQVPGNSGSVNRQSATYREGQTATNPQTGEKLVYRNGRWVSAR